LSFRTEAITVAASFRHEPHERHEQATLGRLLPRPACRHLRWGQNAPAAALDGEGFPCAARYYSPALTKS
jgi:hypothetical protein